MTTATDMLQKYLDAEAAALEGKEIRLDGRLLRFEDLNMIQAGRQYWQRAVNAEQASVSGPTIGGLSFSVGRMDQ